MNPERAGQVVLAVLAVVWFGWIGVSDLGHAYYSASARTLAEHPGWLLSGAFDSGGFITVDKPPVGLWAIALGVAILGANSVGLILPGAGMVKPRINSFKPHGRAPRRPIV